jgi:hypothetical protein
MTKQGETFSGSALLWLLPAALIAWCLIGLAFGWVLLRWMG